MKVLKYISILLIYTMLVSSCAEKTPSQEVEVNSKKEYPQLTETSLLILGTLQDAGSPHIGCKKECCSSLFEHPDPKRKVVSLGVIDPQNNKTFLFEATPNISTQTKILNRFLPDHSELPDGIFITHAHIGHYTGLMYLGKEATNASNIPVYAMPGMKQFLETNGPWDQLVSIGNISISEIFDGETTALTSNLAVTPFVVPHRDEYSETVGYKIKGPNKSALFLPDIDKWEKWDTSIIEAISEVDYAFLDATFYDGNEISRDISEIPHPFIIESMETFKNLPSEEKNKIYFIHFNHTNPVLNEDSKAYKTVLKNGFKVASIGEVLSL